MTTDVTPIGRVLFSKQDGEGPERFAAKRQVMGAVHGSQKRWCTPMRLLGWTRVPVRVGNAKYTQCRTS